MMGAGKTNLSVAALIAGLMLLSITVGCGLVWQSAFFRACLVAGFFWIGLPLGTAALLMIHCLSGGRWSRSILAQARGLLLATPLLSIPLLLMLFGLKNVYPWTDRLLEGHGFKAAYLDVTFYSARSLFYLFVWIAGLGWLYAHTRPGKEHAAWALPLLGLMVYVLTATFSAIDWIASLTPHWHSSIFGLYAIMGQLTGALSFLILLRTMRPTSREWPDAAVLRDLGNLMMAFIALWAYLAFSQYLIIWSGNLPEETAWYASRSKEGWAGWTILLMALHFVIPFFMLLPRSTKQNPRRLALASGLVFGAHILDTAWLILPSFETLDTATLLESLGALFAAGLLLLSFLLKKPVGGPIQPIWPAKGGA